MTSSATTGRRFGDLTPTLLGFVGLAVSITAMLILHVVSSGQINPWSTTLSDYVFVSGYGWLFPVAVLGIAVAGFAVLGTLRHALSKPGTLLRLSVTLASVCCVLVAAFPTTRVGPLTPSAQIHRYAAGVAFCCLPIAAWLLAARLRATSTRTGRVVRLNRTAIVSSLILAVFLSSQLGLLPEPVQHLRGLFQRAQLLVQLLILGQFLGTLTPASLATCLPSASVCLPRTWQTHARAVQTRPEVVETLPAHVG